MLVSTAAPPVLLQKEGEISGRNWLATAKATFTPAHLSPLPRDTVHPLPKHPPMLPTPWQAPKIPNQSSKIGVSGDQPAKSRATPSSFPSAASRSSPLTDAGVRACGCGSPWFPKPEAIGRVLQEYYTFVILQSAYNQLAGLYFCYTRCIFIVSLQQKIYGVSRLSV